MRSGIISFPPFGFLMRRSLKQHQVPRENDEGRHGSIREQEQCWVRMLSARGMGAIEREPLHENARMRIFDAHFFLSYELLAEQVNSMILNLVKRDGIREQK